MDGSTAVLSTQCNLENNNNFIFTICPPPLYDGPPHGAIPPIVTASSSNLPFLNQSMDDLLNELSSKSCSDASSEKILNGLPFSPTANISPNGALDYSPTQHDPSMNEFLNIYGVLFDSASMPTTGTTSEPTPPGQQPTLSPENNCLKQGPSSPISIAFNMKNMINSLEMLKEPNSNNIGESTTTQTINSELDTLTAAYFSPKIAITDISSPRFSSISPTLPIDATANSPSCSLQNVPPNLYPGLVLPPNLFVPIVPAAPAVGDGTGVNENYGYNSQIGPPPQKSINKAEARKIRNRLSAARSNLRRRNKLLARKSELGHLNARISELRKKEGSIRDANEKLRQEIISATARHPITQKSARIELN